MITTLPASELALNPADPSVSQYLLVCHARSLDLLRGSWSFSLESLSGEAVLEADDEDDGDLNRLSLLAAVRGLEAIDGGSLVSLVSNNRYLIRSLDQSLPRWRENDFVWEHFGRRVPVQNADLWRRIDRTLSIHQVTASLIQTTRVSSGRIDGSGLAESAVLRNDADHRQVLPAIGPRSGDRLRSWLSGSEDASVRPIRRRRYRTEDLALD